MSCLLPLAGVVLTVVVAAIAVAAARGAGGKKRRRRRHPRARPARRDLRGARGGDGEE
jgi:hypothetical protein